jgi:hypothetical protein
MFGATMNAARRTATTAFQNPTVRRGLQIAGAGMSGYNAVKGVHDINKSRIGFMDALNMPKDSAENQQKRNRQLMGHGIGAISNGIGLIPNPAASVVGTTGSFMSDNILNQGEKLGNSTLTAGGDTLKTIGGLGKGLPYAGLSVVGSGMKAFAEREKYKGMASSALNTMGQVNYQGPQFNSELPDILSPI